MIERLKITTLIFFGAIIGYTLSENMASHPGISQHFDDTALNQIEIVENATQIQEKAALKHRITELEALLTTKTTAFNNLKTSSDCPKDEIALPSTASKPTHQDTDNTRWIGDHVRQYGMPNSHSMQAIMQMSEDTQAQTDSEGEEAQYMDDSEAEYWITVIAEDLEAQNIENLAYINDIDRLSPDHITVLQQHLIQRQFHSHTKEQ